MRRAKASLNGILYCANTSLSLKKRGDKKKVHDLDNEDGRCQIKRIIEAGHAKTYNSLSEAHRDGFDNCHWCLGRSTR